ncbi:hypothetical protein B6D60_10580 [candidate division KSB1 bacterium 4484_87]|nr:MAG: hypothetical protein B6D60_10580 [candidate division KSB1 bacterium 4484_87]
MKRVEKAIHKIIFECLKIKQSESLLVVTDDINSELADLFVLKASSRNVESFLLQIPRLKSESLELSATARRFVNNTNTIVLLTEPSLVHSKIIAHACHNGNRIICLNGTDTAILEKSVNVDYDFISRMCSRIADIFSIGRKVEVTTRAGTDISFRISRHKGNVNDGCAQTPGTFGILPAGEAYVIPDKKTMNGIVVIDGSIPEIGLVETPLKLYIKDGFVTQVIGDEIADIVRKRIKRFGKNGRNVAEFGIGANPGVTLTGRSIADEKKLGTAHIALGDHLAEGGSTPKKLHLDMVFHKPTVIVDGRPLLTAGKLMD